MHYTEGDLDQSYVDGWDDAIDRCIRVIKIHFKEANPEIVQKIVWKLEEKMANAEV